MKITFNGTGASEGFPALFCECTHCTKVRTMDSINFRMRSSCLIDKSLLVDFSADTYARCLYGKLDLTKVKDIIITHSHSDHFYPQDLCKIMPPYGTHDRKRPLQIYGNESVGKALEDVGITDPRLGRYLQFNLLKTSIMYSIDDYEITPLLANHDPKQSCFIYVIQKDNKTLLYGHDSGCFLDETWSELAAFTFDGVILDCTTVEEKCPYPSHMGIPDNIKIRERMYKDGMANSKTIFILTHFAHTNAPFHERVNRLASDNGFIAAYDGFQTKI